MGAFDKKTKRNIRIGSLIIGVIAVLANISQIIDVWDKLSGKNTDNNGNTGTTIVAESPDNSSQEKNEPPKTEKVTQLQTEPPTEPPETEPPVVYLDSLTLSESSGFHDDISSISDTVGNTYLNHVLLIGNDYDWNSYGMYYLGGKYKTLSGTIAVDIESHDTITGELFISCDDNVVYSTGKTKKSFAPVEISLDVEGCQWIKFSLESYTEGLVNRAWDNVHFILSEFKLEQ